MRDGWETEGNTTHNLNYSMGHASARSKNREMPKKTEINAGDPDTE